MSPVPSILESASAAEDKESTIEERKVESSGSTERLRDGGCNGESSQGPFTHTDMASSSGEDASFANASSTEPRSRRVGITGPPSSFRLSSSTSNTETSDSASFSTPPSSPSLFAAISPPRPPRSPLRPTPPTRRASASLLKHEQIDLSPDCDEMPLSHSRSLGSFSGLLASQPASAKSSRSVRSQTPDKPLPITPDPSISAVSVNDDDRDRDREPENDQKELEDALSVNSEFVSLSVPASGSSLGPGSFLQPRPTVSKRVHALEELLSTERAYASDLALIRDVHIPLASGEYSVTVLRTYVLSHCVAGLPAPFLAAPPTPPPSGPSSRTQSTSSDAPSHVLDSASSICGSEPPMTREDIRIIFNNVADIAAFSDRFTEQIEEALGSILEGGSGEDRIGALFIEMAS